MKVERPFAHCCAEAGGHVSACDCVNKDHGTAWFEVAEPLPASSMPAIYVRLSDDNQYIRKWDRKPFEGGTAFYAAGFPAAASTPTAVSGSAESLREAVTGITDDFMTSEAHHPGYVLIPTAKFEQLRAAAEQLS